MPDHAARPAGAVYDEAGLAPLGEASSADGSPPTIFDREEDAPAGRRRVAHDWGADDLFNQMPRRRRFERTPAGSRHLELVPAQAEPDLENPVGGSSAPAGPGPAAAHVDQADELAAVIERFAAAGPVPEPAREPASQPGGRRTVTITGHPGAVRRPVVAGRRPPRTVRERLGTSPDRIAGWACGLGLLLILVAVSTADAAPL